MRKFRNIEVIVLDLDGTLVDSMGIYADRAAELIEENYQVTKVKARELYFQTSGLPFAEQLEVLFPNNPKNREVSEKFESWKRSILPNLKVERAGAELIEKLKQQGFLTAISSNNLLEYVVQIVKNGGAKPDFVLGWDGKEFKKGKPHIDYLEKNISIPRRQYLMLGDSPNDYRLAREAGVHFAALLREFPAEAFKKLDPSIPTLEKIEQLLDLVL